MGLCSLSMSACVSVDNFSSDPEAVCTPNSVDLSWAVSLMWNDFRDIELSVVETDAPDGAFPTLPHRTPAANGSFPVSIPEGTTRFGIYARGTIATDRDELVVEGLGAEIQDGMFTFEPVCRADGAVEGWDVIQVSGFGPSVRPRAITNVSDREITVSHQGVDRVLRPGETSSAWNSTSLQGGWSIAADARTAEMIVERCDIPRERGGAVSPIPRDDGTLAVRVQPLSLAYTYACD